MQLEKDKNLILKLLHSCKSMAVESLLNFSSGYFESRIRLGGQGYHFNGIMYRMSLQECPLVNPFQSIFLKSEITRLVE
jgi:hypothetical protein